MKKQLISSGAKWEDIVGYSRAVKIGKAHGEFFRTIKPASTMVEVKGLVNPDMLVEIEATAILNE